MRNSRLASAKNAARNVVDQHRSITVLNIRGLCIIADYIMVGEYGSDVIRYLFGIDKLTGIDKLIAKIDKNLCQTTSTLPLPFLKSQKRAVGKIDNSLLILCDDPD